MYAVIDTTNHVVRAFKTRQEAEAFRFYSNRFDWTIQQFYLRGKKATAKQQSAVRFVEEYLDIEFEGDINDSADCSIFLDCYLDDAKRMYDELYDEYQTYIGY